MLDILVAGCIVASEASCKFLRLGRELSVASSEMLCDDVTSGDCTLLPFWLK